MKKITRILATALALSLTLTACSTNKQKETKIETQVESVKETAKETQKETQKEGITKAQSVYLGDELFAEEAIVNGKPQTQLIVVHVPEGTELKVGQRYGHEYKEMLLSFPPQVAVDKIEHQPSTGTQNISEDIARNIMHYVPTSRAVYKEADTVIEDSIEATDENLDNLDKETIMIAYGKDVDRLVETLREKGFKVVLEIAK